MTDANKSSSTSSSVPDPPHDTISRSFDVVTAMLSVLGPGEHAITCTVHLPEGIGFGRIIVRGHDSEPWQGLGSPWDLADFVAVLATGLDERHHGAIIVRSRIPHGNGKSEGESLRAWALDGTWPQPLTSAEVRTAYLTHSVTGESLASEPNITYLPGITLTRPAEPEA